MNEARTNALLPKIAAAFGLPVETCCEEAKCEEAGCEECQCEKTACECASEVCEAEACGCRPRRRTNRPFRLPLRLKR